VPQLILFLVFGGAMAYLANRKGYSPRAWFLAAGLLGLIILGVLPNLSKANLMPEGIAKKARTGNIIGGTISGLVIVLIVVLATSAQ
jgi:hypothetical protein